MARKTLVLDVDNTLIDNVHDYSGPILDAVSLMIQELGWRAPHVTSIINLIQKTDEARKHETNPRTGKPFLYSMDRFPGSLVRTYQVLCEQAALIPKGRAEVKLQAIGKGAFDSLRYIKNVRPGAAAFTRRARKMGHQVKLLSKGDEQVQNRKVAALAAAGVEFDGMPVVVASDKAMAFALILHDHLEFVSSAASDCISIGDSYEGDIEPALKLGYRCIWIPVENWEQIGKLPELRERAKAAGVSEVRDIRELNRRLAEF